mgnify:CR=1 FL=1
MKKTKIILFLIFLLYPIFSYSHVNHYDKLKMIEMDVIRNGKKIGYNKYSFRSQNNLLIVKNEINFAAKLMGINLLVVNGSSTETYKNGKLIKFNSDTIQNKKEKYNKLILDENNKTSEIDENNEPEYTPKLFSEESYQTDEVMETKERENLNSDELFNQDSNEDEDFEIPAFLRKQKF